MASGEQLEIARRIAARGHRREATPVELKAAIETLLVEAPADDPNPAHGTGGSVGWRQELPTYGSVAKRRNVEGAADRFFTEARSLRRAGISAGELAARVQRPAEQYRGRYGEHSGEADAILRQLGLASAGDARGSSSAAAAPSSAAEGGGGSDQAKALLGQMLVRRGRGDSPLIRLGVLPGPGASPAASMLTPQTASQARSSVSPTPPAGSRTQPNGGARRAVYEASRRLGVSETGGSNRGKRLDDWQRKYGMLGQPWCGIFVGLSLEKAGVHGVTSRVASVAAIEDDARAGRNGFARFLPSADAQPGDALITRKGGHVGLVESVDPDGTIHTIEGNTGSGTVARRTHRPQDTYGVARPRYRK